MGFNFLGILDQRQTYIALNKRGTILNNINSSRQLTSDDMKLRLSNDQSSKQQSSEVYRATIEETEHENDDDPEGSRASINH